MAPPSLHPISEVFKRHDQDYDFVSGEPTMPDTSNTPNTVKGSVAALIVVVVAVFILLSISWFCVHGHAQQKRKGLHVNVSANGTIPSASGIFGERYQQQQQSSLSRQGCVDEDMEIARVEPAVSLGNDRVDAKDHDGHVRGSQVGVAV